MMPNETKRTFTPEQSQAMYAFIEKLAQVSLLANPMTGGVYPLGVEARQVLLDLQAIASTPAAPAQDAGRYSVTTGEYGEYGASVAIYVIYDRVRGRHLDGAYRDEAEANAAARDLNAEQGGDNS